MARMTKEDWSAHDKGVVSTAQELERMGWHVQADITGWERPPSVAGRRPDVYAQKNGYTRIVEVETKQSFIDDKLQVSSFKRHAAQKDRTSFFGIVVNSAGSRIEDF